VNKRFQSRLGLILVSVLAIVGLATSTVNAQSTPPPGPQNGSAGLQGTVQTPPPKNAPTIATPATGQSFNKLPVTVSGLCTSGLLVKIFANNVFVGSVLCGNGSYTVQIDLFEGQNDLVARIFDALDQPGPDSNIVTVTYSNNQFNETGIPLLRLSSIFARRGANPGETLNWPITISGGTSPYAISVDWGDGKPATLYSAPFAGSLNISHVYDNAGTYVIIVKGTDKNGLTAFLQLVAQANGAVGQSGTGDKDGKDKEIIIKVIWIPAAFLLALLPLSFWLGRRYELLSLRRSIDRAGRSDDDEDEEPEPEAKSDKADKPKDK
jgi:hypothetical protein